MTRSYTSQGRRLKAARVAAEFTQEQVVAALFLQGVSVTRQAVSSWERGQSTPRLPLRGPIAAVLNAAPADLFEVES